MANAANTATKYGQIKEQIVMEHMARRNYARCWARLDDSKLRNVYNPDRLNEHLKSELSEDMLCPYKYTGEGESYFVSQQMYEQLLATCRCGRPRSGCHLLACMRRARHRLAEDGASEKAIKLPETTNGEIGLLRDRPKYAQWEQSTKYVSPIATMPGQRITAQHYDVLFIA